MKNKYLFLFCFSYVLSTPSLTFATCIGNDPDLYQESANPVKQPIVEISVEQHSIPVNSSIKLVATAVVDSAQDGEANFLWCTKTGNLTTTTSDYSEILFAPTETGRARIAVQVSDGLGYASIDYVDIEVTAINQVTLEGQVISQDSQPIMDAKVSIGNDTAMTDQNGHWSLLVGYSDNYALTIEKAGFNFPLTKVTNSTEPLVIKADGKTTCQLYAVHDEALNNTQFFAIDVLNDFKVNLLGQLHLGKDIEALTIHPETNQLFAASGKDGNPPGYLYHVNAITGELTEVGGIGYQDINGIAFNPQDQSLWGWAVGDGLIQINPTTAESSLHLPFTGHVEDIAWNNSGDTLYAVADNKFYSYTPATETVQQLDCEVTAGEIEAIEIMPGGNDQELLYSTHNDKTLSIHKLNIQTCETAELSISTEVDGINLNDVEGIALPISACYR